MWLRIFKIHSVSCSFARIYILIEVGLASIGKFVTSILANNVSDPAKQSKRGRNLLPFS